MRPQNVANYKRLKEWLGEECLDTLIDASRGFKHVVPVANVPGDIWAYDGELYGVIKGAAENFTSFSDLIEKATTQGKRQDPMFYKVSTLAVNNAYASLWNVGVNPPAGGLPPNIPSGTAPNNLSTGSFRQYDPESGTTLRITTIFGQGSVGPNTLMLYDRLWHGASGTHTQTGAQVINGSPSRYLGTGSYGNFAFLEPTTALGATAQTMTMTYIDGDGNGPKAAPALSMIASSVVTRIPHVPWFIPLQPGDVHRSLRRVTQIQFSAANSAGLSNIVIGRSLAFIPCPVANTMMIVDGINSAFNFAQVQSGACLALIECKGVGTATNYTGQMILVST